MPEWTLGSRRNKSHQVYTPVTSTDPADADPAYQIRQARWPRVPRPAQHAISFFAGVVMTSLFFIMANNRNCSARRLSFTHAFRSPVPEIPLTSVTFENNRSFSAPSSIETDQIWNTLLPPGRGFVFVNNSGQYNLEPGEATKWGEIYSVSLFHQLHCLGQLRKAYWTLIKGVEDDDTRQSELLLGPHGDHVTHCFDYLRQGIMCAGDMSLEWPRTEPNGDRFAVDGWGVPHQCKSWDAISNYMQKAHFNHSMNSRIAPGPA